MEVFNQCMAAYSSPHPPACTHLTGDCSSQVSFCLLYAPLWRLHEQLRCMEVPTLWWWYMVGACSVILGMLETIHNLNNITGIRPCTVKGQGEAIVTRVCLCLQGQHSVGFLPHVLFLVQLLGFISAFLQLIWTWLKLETASPAAWTHRETRRKLGPAAFNTFWGEILPIACKWCRHAGQWGKPEFLGQSPSQWEPLRR